MAEMIGGGLETRAARRTIAHGFYVTAGLSAVLTGILNPVGILITIMSAAASSFGGLAGFISVGFATRREGQAREFVVQRNWPLIVAGGVALVAFATFLGPSLEF